MLKVFLDIVKSHISQNSNFRLCNLVLVLLSRDITDVLNKARVMEAKVMEEDGCNAIHCQSHFCLNLFSLQIFCALRDH